jgi:hypothetical protein
MPLPDGNPDGPAMNKETVRALECLPLAGCALPTVGDTVDRNADTYANSIGSAELRARGKDPNFDPHRHAAYYVRVLEIPTPRWSTLLAADTGLPLPSDVPATIQQRDWSSPI